MIELSPLTVFWILLAGGVIVSALARLHSRFVDETAVAVSGLSLLVWLILKSRLPLVVTVSEWSSATRLPPWIWRVDEFAWHMSWVLLLLVTGILISRASARYSKSEVASDAVHSNQSISFHLLFVTVAGLVTLWADSLAGVMAGWVILIMTWANLAATASDEVGVDSRRSRSRSWAGVGWLLLSLFFLWLAAAYVPSGDDDSLLMGGWPQVSTSSILTAALLQMGIWPFHAWRRLEKTSSPGASTVLHVIPALAGASLLARLITTSDVSMGYRLFLTAFGLLGMLLGVIRALVNLHMSTRMIASIALVQTSLVLLAGVWAGPEALLAELRVMVLAVGILFVASAQRSGRINWWQTISSGVALVAMIGLPLTAGFAGRGALYNIWLANGRFMLMFVSSLIYLPLVTAIALIVWGEKLIVTESPARQTMPSGILQIVGSLLLAVGLVTIGGLSLGEVRFVAWLALLLPILGGVALFRYIEEVQGPRTALQHAFSVNFSLDASHKALRALITQIGVAIRDAITILEGEGGLLWVLVLVVVFLLLR